MLSTFNNHHPLLTLQPEEVSRTAGTIRKEFPNREIIFRVIAIKEPRRADVTRYLEAERLSQPLPHIPRRTYFSYQFRHETESYEDVVDLESESVVKRRELPYGVHPPASQDDMREVQELVMTDELVIAEIQRLKLPHDAKVVPEAWPYGKDTPECDPKQYQVWFFLGSIDSNNQAHPSSNHFAHPLDFTAVVDDVTRKVIRVDRLPMGSGLHSISGDDEPYKPQPDSDYAKDLQPSLRQDVKPIIISQPEGVSFTVEFERCFILSHQISLE